MEQARLGAGAGTEGRKLLSLRAPEGALELLSATGPDPQVLPLIVEPFEAFYHREYRGCVALAYALTGSGTEAEDLAQEAFLAAHRRWDEIGRYERPVGWLRRVVANKSASVIRRRVAEHKALTRLAGRRASSLAPLSGPDAEFWAAVRTLPRRQAQIVALHYLFDLAVRDVAATLQISDGAVKAHLHRARVALARTLGPWEETD